VVVSNLRGARAWCAPAHAGVPARPLVGKDLSREAYDESLAHARWSTRPTRRPGRVSCGSYPPSSCPAVQGRILNIHPSLLPSYPCPRTPTVSCSAPFDAPSLLHCTFVTFDLDAGPAVLHTAFLCARTTPSSRWPRESRRQHLILSSRCRLVRRRSLATENGAACLMDSVSRSP